MCEIDWAGVATFSKEMLTPLIAAIALYIAWQQWKTNDRKFILDRYDRRIKVYDAVVKILRAILQRSKVTDDELYIFEQATTESDFLFGPGISAYIEEIYDHIRELSTWNSKYRDFTQQQPEDYDHEKVCAGLAAERKWLSHQFIPAKEKFKKYLDISK
jgi:hypothetical protein